VGARRPRRLRGRPARCGFDDLEFYRLFERDRSTWHMAVDSVRPANAPAPFDAWLANAERTDY
jgi:guanine deaminase